MKFLQTPSLPKGRPPADDIFAYSCCPQPVPARSVCPGPGPAEETQRRHGLAGLLAVGIAAVIRGRGRSPRSAWAADAGPEALAVLGAARGPRRSPSSGAPSPWSAPTYSTGSSVPGCIPGRCRPAGAGDQDRRQNRPRREGQDREGPAPGRGAGARHRRGPRPGRSTRVERDPRGAGTAEGVRQPGRCRHHDRRHAHAGCTAQVILAQARTM